jgi:hypothetical protein
MEVSKSIALITPLGFFLMSSQYSPRLMIWARDWQRYYLSIQAEGYTGRAKYVSTLKSATPSITWRERERESWVWFDEMILYYFTILLVAPMGPRERPRADLNSGRQNGQPLIFFFVARAKRKRD